MAFEMKPLVPGDKKGWTAEIHTSSTDHAEAIRSIRFIELSSKFGTLRYGKRPEGYDSWTYEYDGGAVTVPHAVTPEGELLVALVREARENVEGGPYFYAIGGFIEPGESAETAQARETKEESGLAGPAEPLPGLASIADRAFFVAEPVSGKGSAKAFNMAVPFEELEPAEFGSFRVKTLGDFKKPDDVRFFKWQDAVRYSPDALARAGIAQLLVEKLPSAPKPEAGRVQ